MTVPCRVAIMGAGRTGLGAAWKLHSVTFVGPLGA